MNRFEGGSFLQTPETLKDKVSHLCPRLSAPPHLRPAQVRGDQAAPYWLRGAFCLGLFLLPQITSGFSVSSQVLVKPQRTDSPESFRHEDSIFLSCSLLLFLIFLSICKEKNGRDLLSRPKAVSKAACSQQTAFLILFMCLGPTILSDSDVKKTIPIWGKGTRRGCCCNLKDFRIVTHTRQKMLEGAGHRLPPKLQVCIFPFLCIPFRVSTPPSTPRTPPT